MGRGDVEIEDIGLAVGNRRKLVAAQIFDGRDMAVRVSGGHVVPGAPWRNGLFDHDAQGEPDVPRKGRAG